MRLVDRLGEAAGVRVEQARRDGGAFRSPDDLRRRAGIDRRVLAALGSADAFGSLGVDRRQALWNALGQETGAVDRPLFAAFDDEPCVTGLPAAGAERDVFDDYASLGLSLKNHPVSFHRRRLDSLGVLAAERLQDATNGQRVKVAGVVLLRQRPGTAKGITFVTIEDETGAVNLIIHPRTWERHFRVAKRSRAWIATGELQHAAGVIHVVVTRIEALTAGAIASPASRDFH
jgi:error-prone DNA polymerase